MKKAKKYEMLVKMPWFMDLFPLIVFQAQ